MHNLTTNFGRFLDICNQFGKRFTNAKGNISRRGVVPKFSDLKVVALSLTAEALSKGEMNIKISRLVFILGRFGFCGYKISNFFSQLGKKHYLCIRFFKNWYLGRVVRHRSAKPSTPVRLRKVPLLTKKNHTAYVVWFFYLRRSEAITGIFDFLFLEIFADRL